MYRSGSSTYYAQECQHVRVFRAAEPAGAR
jgi:hypothetical protein